MARRQVHVFGVFAYARAKGREPDACVYTKTRELAEQAMRGFRTQKYARVEMQGGPVPANSVEARSAEANEAAESRLHAAKRNPGPVNIFATYGADATGAHPVLDSALDIAERAKALPVPYVTASVSQLGGPARASATVKLSLDPKDSWVNGIFQNSRHALFSVDPRDMSIEMFSGSKVPKFRKARFKTPAEAIAKIAKWAKEAGVHKNPAAPKAAQARRLLAAASIPAEVRGKGADYEVEVDAKHVSKVRKLLGAMGGYKTGYGAYVLRHGYKSPGDYNNRASRWHY